MPGRDASPVCRGSKACLLLCWRHFSLCNRIMKLLEGSRWPSRPLVLKVGSQSWQHQSHLGPCVRHRTSGRLRPADPDAWGAAGSPGPSGASRDCAAALLLRAGSTLTNTGGLSRHQCLYHPQMIQVGWHSVSTGSAGRLGTRPRADQACPATC